MPKKLTKLRIPLGKTILTWAMQWGLWLLFADNAGIREMCIGVIAAGFATLAAMVFASNLLEDFYFKPKWVAEVIRLPWYVITGTREVLIALARQLFTRRGAESFIGAVPFTVGGKQPSAVGRRTLAVTFTTATPNSIVFAILRKERLLLYHQVYRTKIHAVTRSLGAKP